MRKKDKLALLETKIFQLEATVAILELTLHNLMLSQGLDLDSNKWYTHIDNS